MDTMHGTMTAVGGDVGSLQDACEAAVRESTAVRAAIAALRSESEERLAVADLRSRDEVAEVRDAVQRVDGELGDVRGAVARLDGEIGSVRDTVGRLDGEVGAVRGAGEALREDVHALRGEVGHAAEDLDAARGLIAILRDESVTGDRAIESLRQVIEGAREEAHVATGAIGAARDEMDLVHAGLERTQEETRALREELSLLRRDAAPIGALPAAVVPEGLRELTDAVEALRSGLARQDVLVDARIITSHRATEALRGELTEMRAQMQEMVALMRDQAPAARPASDDPLAALLETLGGQVTTLRRLAERVPGGRLLWAAVFPAPVLSLATALVRRFAPRPS
jgi:chromosome segregation ATPase